MPGPTHEQTLNAALGEALDGLRRSWNARAEQTGNVLEGGGRPDVLVEDASGWPVVIEAERADHASAERDAIARLGRVVAGRRFAIETAIALVYPDALTYLDGARLRNALDRTDELEYALYTRRVGESPERLPEDGWVRGSVRDLAMLTHRAAAPAPRVEALAQAFEMGVERAADEFTRRHQYGGDIGRDYNLDLRFNSQSLIAAMTERPCIGGRAWPSVLFENADHEYAFALWCNSTLGLLMHWWMANKTQSGRGATTVTGIPNIPSLDARALSAERHAAAKDAFDAMRGLRFLPFDQIDEDPARAELDRRLLVDVLGLPESLCAENGPLDLLRRKLAREPQIHGGKKSRVVLDEARDAHGALVVTERKERRNDR